MRFTKKLVSSFAALLLAGACTDIGSSDTALSGGKKDDAVQAGDCTLTQGFWKNHPGAWPVSSLKLGNKTYSKDELIEILTTPVMGNGLIKLAHQLIAAKLNIAAGADDAEIKATITAADALIADLEVGVDRLPSRDVSELNDKLDAFNNGDIGPGHCEKAPPSCGEDDDGECDGGDDDDDGDDDGCDHDDDGDCDHDDDDSCGGDCDHDDDGDCDGGDHDDHACGDGHVDLPTETCDDGNTVANDGCSATCQLEVPVCGNGKVEAGEECDDGNLDNGDGCSAVCVVTCPTTCH